MIRPRIRSTPPALGTRGGELIELAERLGYELDDWQRLAANDILAVDENGRLAAFEAALVVARQCGKSLAGELYALNFALAGEAVLFTSHRADSSKLIFRRLLASLPAELEADPTFTNGAEEIRFPGGGVVVFRTRGPRTARGFRFQKIILDESQVLKQDEYDAMLPTLRTSEDAQLLFLGCAGNGRLNEHCALLWSLRQRARRGGSDRLCYLEWAAAVEDGEGDELQADQLSEEMLDDETLWRQAKPASDARIPLERMRDEREALDATSFAVELLTVWIPPEADGLGGGPVTLAAWDELVDEASELNPEEPIPEAILSFDMSRTRLCSLCLSGRRADTDLHLDHVGRYEGAAAAAEVIDTICGRNNLSVRAVVCDGTPENLALLARLRHDGVIYEAQAREQHASRLGVQACAGLVDLVAEGKFRHRGQHEFRDALRGGVVKSLGESSWVYSRSRSRADVSPLLAAAAALYVADQELDVAGAAAPQVF